jgi:hypothetical protein
MHERQKQDINKGLCLSLRAIDEMWSSTSPLKSFSLSEEYESCLSRWVAICEYLMAGSVRNFTWIFCVSHYDQLCRLKFTGSDGSLQNRSTMLDPLQHYDSRSTKWNLPSKVFQGYWLPQFIGCGKAQTDLNSSI